MPSVMIFIYFATFLIHCNSCFEDSKEYFIFEILSRVKNDIWSTLRIYVNLHGYFESYDNHVWNESCRYLFLLITGGIRLQISYVVLEKIINLFISYFFEFSHLPSTWMQIRWAHKKARLLRFLFCYIHDWRKLNTFRAIKKNVFFDENSKA